MASRFVAVSLALSATRALCSTFDSASSRDTFNNTILATPKNFTPIPYNISASPISPDKGQKIVMLEFPYILANSAQPFSGIFWGSALPNVTEIVLLVSEGVGVLDEAVNYSTACSDATTIFNSTLTFTNCLQLGFTSVLLDSGLISLNEDSVQIAHSYLNFGDIRSLNGSGILNDIATCISATCQTTSTGTCSWDVSRNLKEAYDPQYNATEKLKRLYMGFNAYCDGQLPQANGDVFGPGVLIASFTQFAAVSFFFLASKFHRWARRIKAWHQKPWARSDGKTYVPTQGPQADPNSKPGGPMRAVARFSTAVESVFVDFHEAQIFFLLTIQTATFWFFNQKKVIETSATYADANTTSFLAIFLSLTVLIPVFLGQTIQQRSGRHWWYTTLLTSIAAVMAWMLIETLTNLDYARFWTKLKTDNPITQCGGNPSPSTYCGVYHQLYNLDSELDDGTITKDVSVI
ncbi:hypothetical protein F4678DRAFT_478855 [Xylaria arbuscula]|nr:hypothetical protein F4678DRAFT_478855 [Xylaria arbuscula]